MLSEENEKGDTTPLANFLIEVAKIPAALLQTKEGVSLASILAGTMMKAQGGFSDIKIDAFPFTIGPIPQAFGEMPVPDLLIGVGLLGMSAEFVKGLGEIVPL